MVDTFAVTGTPDQAVDKLRPRREALDHVILSGPTNGVPPERVEANLHALIQALSVR
jgi:alkanesulfonate monooxygenase SsuD/methylene tetrahydromethanopterin reductase-like flavin-dependent oxidoreductase (luciferase family)